MKQILLFSLFICLSFMLNAQSITGKVVDGSTGEAVIGASVVLKGTSTGTITDIDGRFNLMDKKESQPVIVVSFMGYSPQEVSFSRESSSLDVGTILLNESSVGLEEIVVTGNVDIVRDRRTPVAVSTIKLEELQTKAIGNVEFPEVMKSTPSVYVSNQTGFGDAQMFLRGFNQSNTAFLLNGQPINGMEDGKMYWSNWSGMSDVATAVQIQRGLGSSKLAISSVGGTVNIVTRTIENKKGGFARVMYGNDNYFKSTFSYNTGVMDSGLAVSFLLDHWQADNKWALGTKGQGQNYFLSLGYAPKDSKHSFNFLITGAPQNHGNRWSQKVKTLEKTPKFNQHWGTYKGEWMSERFNYYHKPIINLSWDYDINNDLSLSSVLYGSFGRGGGTGPYGKGRVRTADGQVDFDAIEKENLLDTIGSFGGSYARRASVNNHQWFGNVTSIKSNFAQYFTASAGMDLRFYRGDHFRQLVNLYGLQGWEDTYRNTVRPKGYVVKETFSVNPWKALTNFADSDQRIAYDYSENINYQGLFGQLEFAPEFFSAFVQAAVSNQSYQREGRWADVGKSDKVNKIGYNIKGGASYAINLNNTVFANAGYYSRQPFLDNIYENVRYSNKFITPEVENENVIGFEGGYKYFNNSFSANLNAYYTTWGNRTNVFTFTNNNGTEEDESDDFEQRNVEKGIAQLHKGVELDLQYRMGGLVAKLFGNYGDWKFTKIKSVDQYNEDTGEKLLSVEGDDISAVHIPNSPQTAVGFGLSYDFDFGLNVSVDGNYYDRIYRRDNFNANDPVLRKDIGTLDPYFLLDAGIGYKFKLNDSQNLALRANVYNVLDKFYINQTDPYGSLNGNGRTWNVSLKYNF